MSGSPEERERRILRHHYMGIAGVSCLLLAFGGLILTFTIAPLVGSWVWMLGLTAGSFLAILSLTAWIGSTLDED